MSLYVSKRLNKKSVVYLQIEDNNKKYINGHLEISSVRKTYT